MGLFLGRIFDYLLDIVVYLIRSTVQSFHSRGSGSWPKTEAIATADPERRDGIGGSVVEIVYSYRVGGELYTGMHEQPIFLGDTEYQERFIKGRHFVVRVKPGEPEVSTLRNGDQSDGLVQRLGPVEKP